MVDYSSVKPFKEYSEQLEILKKRGMLFADDESAIGILRSENYYRLSGYWLSLLVRATNKDEDDSFYPGTRFEDVLDLYYFDAELRSIILAATSTIEVNLKSFVAYYHSEKYGPLGYLNYINFENVWYHNTMLSSLFADMKKQKDKAFVKHHIDDRGKIFPIWVATELFTFDQISKFYKNMLPKDKLAVAKEYYGIASYEYIESWLECAVVARNTAAHGARFYNRKTIGPGAKLPKELNSHSKTFLGYLYSIFTLLPLSERKDFIQRVEACIRNHPFVKLEHLDLAEDWKTIFISADD